ncbi:hypothetical protein MRS44_010995 [Fusarium solani]|uniref:uncharacterized protein n=1 Tax=Fusarium solani TaxID=169388 RepID=UPI0032C48FBE|nr:hypothetical protein MRS44_010995 [Fusarium solani]
MSDRTSPPQENPSQGQPTSSPGQAAPDSVGQCNLLPAEHWAQLEEDPDTGHEDSTYSDNQSSTASLASSILEYRTILGRSFHSERGNAQYWGSNDEEQNNAMDINHHVQYLLLDGKLHLAPLSKDTNTVIDIGTGTGIWAIQIDDCTQDWTFKENSADFVHVRWLVGSIPDWTALFKQAYRCLKPGAYLESHEASARVLSDDGSVHDDSALGQWGEIFIEGGRKIGRPFTVVEEDLQKKAMEAAGFIDVKVTTLKCPIGGWPKDEKLKEVGRYMKLALGQDIEGAVIFMADLLGWKKEEILLYAAHLRRELASTKFHPYYRQNIVVGRKPEE